MTIGIDRAAVDDAALVHGILAAIGDTTSNPDLYINAELSREDYMNLAKVAIERTPPGSPERREVITLLTSAGVITAGDGGDLSEAGYDYWINSTEEELGEDVGNLGDSLSVHFLGGERQGPGGGTPGSTPQAPPQGTLGGGQLTLFKQPGGIEVYAMVYKVGGIEHVYTWDSEEAMKQQLGDDATTKYGLRTRTDTLNDGDTWLLGSAEAFAGQEGTYAGYWDQIQQEAALEAGLRDPGRLGRLMSDPSVQRIIGEGEAGGWSEERIQAEIRRTDAYEAVYPGIRSLIDAGIENPEQAWQTYRNQVQEPLELMGYERDADGSYDSVIGDLLENGISISEIQDFAPVFARAETSQEFAGVLDQWIQRNTGKNLTFEDWMDVLAGTATPELNDIVESATIQFQAERTGTTLTPEQISRLSSLTSLTEAQIAAAFTQAEEALLSVGRADLERFGLSEQALINSAFGVEDLGADPLSSDGSPLSPVEVRRRARRASTELALADDQKDTFFLGFDAYNRPQRRGLAALRPEGG